MGNILVVDDERSIRITVKAFLDADGHCTATAEDAEAAMAVIRERPLDVVLTDIILPGVSGIDLLRQIRGACPEVQVVMMTGEPTLETASDALRLGAVDYLQKPAGKSEILRAVSNALKVKALSDEKQRLEAENRNYLNQLEHLVDQRTQALALSEANLRRRAEELSVLNRLARKVNQSVGVDEVVFSGMQEIAAATSPDLILVLLREKEELSLRGIHPQEARQWWQPADAHRIGVCLCGRAVDQDEAVYSADITTDPRCTMAECRQAGFRSFAALPLRSDAQVIGVLGIASRQARDFRQRATFLDALATELAIGLKKSRLYEEVERHAQELQASLARINESESERRRLETHLQRSQKMEAIGALASGIAHDFNNILGALIGYAELALIDLPQGSASRNDISMILAAGERARDLVKQILAFGRQGEEDRKPIQIANTVREVTRFLRASLPATIDIRQHIDADLDDVLADPVQIHQVVMNLCTNAGHAMHADGGVLELGVTALTVPLSPQSRHPGLKPGPYIKLTVRDSGHGMDKATLEKIFDPYFSTKAKGVGTGLGLAVVHGIVQNHGGLITVDSAPGRGACFASISRPRASRRSWQRRPATNCPGATSASCSSTTNRFSWIWANRCSSTWATGWRRAPAASMPWRFFGPTRTALTWSSRT